MKVKELLSDESKWCKNCEARNNHKTKISPDSPDACQWCLFGAIQKCYPSEEEYEEISNKIYKKFNDIEYFGPMTRWNDDLLRTFKDIKELVEELDI